MFAFPPSHLTTLYLLQYGCLVKLIHFTILQLILVLSCRNKFTSWMKESAASASAYILRNQQWIILLTLSLNKKFPSVRIKCNEISVTWCKQKNAYCDKSEPPSLCKCFPILGILLETNEVTVCSSLKRKTKHSAYSNP